MVLGRLHSGCLASIRDPESKCHVNMWENSYNRFYKENHQTWYKGPPRILYHGALMHCFQFHHKNGIKMAQGPTGHFQSAGQPSPLVLYTDSDWCSLKFKTMFNMWEYWAIQLDSAISCVELHPLLLMSFIHESSWHEYQKPSLNELRMICQNAEKGLVWWIWAFWNP